MAAKVDMGSKRRGASNNSEQPGAEAREVLGECKRDGGVMKSPENGQAYKWREKGI